MTKLVVLLPAYNEEANIEKAILSIPRKINGVKSIQGQRFNFLKKFTLLKKLFLQGTHELVQANTLLQELLRCVKVYPTTPCQYTPVQPF